MGTGSFGGAALKDARRTRRLERLGVDLAALPGGTMTSVMHRAADIKAAYRLLDCPHVTHAAVTQGHFAYVRAACLESGTYLLIEDTTTISFPDREGCVGLGPVGEDHTRGFLLHNTLAVQWSCAADDPYNDAARVLGLAWQQPWARDPDQSRRDETRAQRHHRAARESDRWAKGFEVFGGPGDGGARWIYVADRESDMYEALTRCRKAGVKFVIRAMQDRALIDQDVRLHEALARGKLLGRRTIELPAAPGRPARRATLEVRAATMTLRGPYRAGGKLEDLTIHGVEVKEIGAPQDQDPVHWMLLTDLPMATAYEVWKVVAIYRRRWLIEELHKALKTGVGVERSQLTDVRKLMALTGILSIVCVMLLDMKLLARAEGDVPLAARQVDTVKLEILEKKTGKPAAGWTARSFLIAIAQLGGFLARKGDGPPGWLTIWRGWQRLLLLAEGFDLARLPERCG
jgi:Transposase DDE domain/Transposase DNA-binding/Transposase Tn5 dimerisation domain